MADNANKLTVAEILDLSPEEMSESGISINTILALTPADRFAVMKAAVKLKKKIEDTREQYNTVSPFYGKWVAALKRDHAKQLDDHTIPGGTTFRKYFADNCGGELPGRLETLAAVFNSLCMVTGADGKPLLPEEYYNAASVNSLEIANKCVNHAMKQHGDGWRGSDDVLDVINALSKPGDATKKLKEVRNRQEPKADKASKENANAVTLTPEGAVQFLLGWIATAGDKAHPEDKVAGIFDGTANLVDAWEKSGIAADMLNKWADNRAAGKPLHMERITEAPKTQAPAPVPA